MLRHIAQHQKAVACFYFSDADLCYALLCSAVLCCPLLCCAVLCCAVMQYGSLVSAAANAYWLMACLAAAADKGAANCMPHDHHQSGCTLLGCVVPSGGQLVRGLEEYPAPRSRGSPDALQRPCDCIISLCQEEAEKQQVSLCTCFPMLA